MEGDERMKASTRKCNHLVGYSSGIYMPGDDLWEASDLKEKPERKNYILDCGIAFKFCPRCGVKLPRLRPWINPNGQTNRSTHYRHL